MFLKLVNIHLVSNKIGLNLVKNLSRSTDNSVLAGLQLVWSGMVMAAVYKTIYSVEKFIFCNAK